MRNIPKEGLLSWGVVILTLVLNIVIIATRNNKEDFSGLLIISIALLMLALYNALSGSGFFLSFFKGFRSLSQHAHTELLSHSIYPTKITKDDLRILIGNEQCRKPYDASLLSVESRGNTTFKDSHMELSEKESEALGRLMLSFPNSLNSAAGGGQSGK